MSQKVLKQIKNEIFAAEPLTVTIKKATELYVVGGVAEDEDGDLQFWYAVRKYPIMPRHLREETGTKSKSEYIQRHRPEWTGGPVPQEYVEFYKNLPEFWGEGDPEQIERSHPEKLGPSVVVIEPTIIEYDTEPTGDPDEDIPVVEELIGKVRDLIWQYPVQGKFTSVSGLQGTQLQQFIGSNLKRASRNIRMRRFAQSIRILPQYTRYIDVATGQLFDSEEAVKQAIEEYHNEAAPMAAAASNKGGKLVNSIGELLKVADMLDEQGKFEEADELMNIVKDMAKEQQPAVAADEEPSQEEKKAWVKKVTQTLVKVADSLEGKGALKEAQMADELLVDIRQDLPSAFNAFQSTPQAFQPQDAVSVEEPVISEEPVIEVPFQGLPETPQDSVQELTETPEDLGPQEVEIEEPNEPEANYDELTLNEFKEIIDGLKYRYSQGPKRQKYEEVFEAAQKAEDYYKAYKQWHDHAHGLFDDEPIRLKIE